MSNRLKQVGERLQRSGGPPLYTQLTGLMRECIEAGQLRAGEALLPQRELSALWNVSEVTVRRALQTLAAEGLIQARAGSGTVIAGVAETPLSRSASARLRIGIVMATLSEGYPFLSRMTERLQGSADGPHVQFFNVPVESDADTVRESLPLRDLDGVLLLSPVNLNLVTLCQQRSLPYVLLYNHIADGVSRCIVVDYTSGMLRAVEHLVRRGKKKIALVTAGESRFSTGQMTDAYHAALQVHHLPIDPQWTVFAGYEESQGYAATKELLACEEKPDAILFASDYQARGGLIALQEAKLSVPGEVAVIGAGKLLRDKEWPIALTTIDLHFERIGVAAVETLSKLIHDPQHVPFRQAFPTELILGETA